MTLKTTGKSTSPEVTNISCHGLWLLWNGQEHFLDYAHFPWFKEATVAEISHVETPTPSSLHWPDLDVDLHQSILENPEAYPNVSQG
jgi:hypothetical protein